MPRLGDSCFYAYNITGWFKGGFYASSERVLNRSGIKGLTK